MPTDPSPDPADVKLVEDAWLDATPCTHGVQLDYPEACSGCAARAVLSALAAAGRLTPAGGRTEWGWLSADGATVYASPSEAQARAAASRSGARRLMRRQLGPWQPVTDREDHRGEIMKAEIEVHHDGRGSISIDGHDISMATRGFTLSASIGEEPQLKLDLMLFEDSRLSGEVWVVVPDETAEALKALGWTPPTDGGTDDT